MDNWLHYAFLRHPMTNCIAWFVTPNTIPHITSQIPVMLRYGKNVQLEFFELESWSSDDYVHFFTQLGKMLIAQYRAYGPSVLHRFGLAYPEQCTGQLDTVDVTGKCYRCRYLSPERMIHSSLTRYYAKTQESQMCEAARDILARRPAQQAMAACYASFLQNLAQLLE